MSTEKTDNRSVIEMSSSSASRWHIITSEYPPQLGGVSDYTKLVAIGLAAQGEEVHVWCPGAVGVCPQLEGITIHRELGKLTSRDLLRVGQELNQFADPRRVLVQWVPHGYGFSSMNVMFCWWLWNRAARHGDRVEIMVHEAYLEFRATSWRQSAAALVHRFMTVFLLRAAERVWLSIPEWERRWRPYALGRQISFQWLPIPSNIPVVDNPKKSDSVRKRYIAEGNTLIGHFGTFGWPITSLLAPILLGLVDDSAKQTVLLMGIGSEQFRAELVRDHPRLAGSVHATGTLLPDDLSCHLAACDLLIQPYPDGVSSRRTSFMAGLEHGKPIVTTIGPLTEPFWSETGALAMALVEDLNRFVHLVQMLREDVVERTKLGQAARALYQERFHISHTIAALLHTVTSPEQSVCAS
jgi:glycosyltransferase involved in cell wall biosynthesis